MRGDRRRFWMAHNAARSEATLYVYDVIDQYFGVSAEKMVREIAALDVKTIHVRINSPGGDVFQAMPIFNALERHKAEVVCHVDGLAASAASVIALAGDRLLMGKGSFLMIHNAWGFAIGDAEAMREMADTLDNINGSIIGIYQEATGASESQIRRWMDAETWFNAEEAIEAGFADELEEPKQAAAMLGARSQAGRDLLAKFQHVPETVSASSSSTDELEERRRKVSTKRELELLLRDEGGLSWSEAREVSRLGASALGSATELEEEVADPDPLAEEAELAGIVADLSDFRGKVQSLTSR